MKKSQNSTILERTVTFTRRNTHNGTHRDPLHFARQVSHVSTECDYPLGVEPKDMIEDEWAVSQVRGESVKVLGCQHKQKRCSRVPTKLVLNHHASVIPCLFRGNRNRAHALTWSFLRVIRVRFAPFGKKIGVVENSPTLGLSSATFPACSDWTKQCRKQCSPWRLQAPTTNVVVVVVFVDVAVVSVFVTEQVKSCVDYCHGSNLVTFLSGALNYQVTHHLFPGVSQVRSEQPNAFFNNRDVQVIHRLAGGTQITCCHGSC